MIHAGIEAAWITGPAQYPLRSGCTSVMIFTMSIFKRKGVYALAR